MKSTDLRNWRYQLSYWEITELDDFPELLTKAIATDSCLNCGRGRTDNTGLCLGCSHQLDGKDKKAAKKVLRDYKVSVTLEKRGQKNETNETKNRQKRKRQKSDKSDRGL